MIIIIIIIGLCQIFSSVHSYIFESELHIEAYVHNAFASSKRVNDRKSIPTSHQLSQPILGGSVYLKREHSAFMSNDCHAEGNVTAKLRHVNGGEIICRIDKHSFSGSWIMHGSILHGPFNFQLFLLTGRSMHAFPVYCVA